MFSKTGDTMKKDIVKIGTLLVTISTLLSCGENNKPTRDRNPEEAFTTTTLSLDPIRLTKQNNNCVRAFAENEGAYFYIPQYLSGKSVETRLDFTSQLEGNLVKSPLRKPISKMTYGLDTSIKAFLRFVDGEWRYDDEDIVAETKSFAKELDVCPSVVTYDRFTFESSGLNISDTITKTYEKVTAQGIVLDAVKVNVAPFLYKDIRLDGGPQGRVRTVGYETDNAYYSPSEKEITFLPQSKTYQKYRGNTPFWQMPMVGSHEYGHHIFSTLVGNTIVNSFNFSKNCFQGHDQAAKLVDELEVGAQRDNSFRFALGAINEGFSDLIAKYTLSPEESSMTNIICFARNRDADSDTFGRGAKKVFDKVSLDLISSELLAEAPKTCNHPDLQGIHHVGAVFAFSANKLISSYTQDSDKKLKILLEFAKSLSQSHSKWIFKNAGDYLTESIMLINTTALSVLEKNSLESNCSVLQQIFPDQDLSQCGVESI